MTVEFCPHCKRPMPWKRSDPTDRELDVLAAWWGTEDVRKAADLCGITYQRAKNILARCRSRSGVESNHDLLLMHMDRLRSHLPSGASHKSDRSEAA